MKSPSHLGEIEEAFRESEEGTGLKYSCKMHPITKLAIPEFMEREKESMVDAACAILYAVMPMVLNYFLNYATGLLNIYFIGLQLDSLAFASICMGTVIANILTYYVIEYVGSGFAIVCSYFTAEEKEEVGYMYQKTLAITFLVCVVMTPVIYLSDKILNLMGYDQDIIDHACNYAWALIPSFYLYSFIDTNKNYLQAEGIIFPPIVIHLAAVVVHTTILVFFHLREGGLTMVEAAWAKNLSDGGCALSIYLFIRITKPTEASWVQWSIKSTNNISRFLKEIYQHQSYTYTELIAFQVLCLVACHLSNPQICAHFSYALIYNVVYYAYISLTQCVSYSLAVSIEQNQAQVCKKKISLGTMLCLVFSSVLIINIIHYRTQFIHIFIENKEVGVEIQDLIYLFCAIIFVSGLNCIMLGIVKTMELELYWTYSFAFCYFIGIVTASILCYFYDYGLWGIWLGWLFALLIELYLNLKRVLCFDVDEAFQKIQRQYKKAEVQMRQSKYQITLQAEGEPRA